MEGAPYEVLLRTLGSLLSSEGIIAGSCNGLGRDRASQVRCTVLRFAAAVVREREGRTAQDQQTQRQEEKNGI